MSGLGNKLQVELSFTITRIRATLDDLELLESKASIFWNSTFQFVKQRLRNVRTFLLCLRQLGDDADLIIVGIKNRDTKEKKKGKVKRKSKDYGSLSSFLPSAVCRWNIRPYCLCLEKGFREEVMDMIDHLGNDIKSFQEEIDEWYTILQNHLQQSISPMVREEVLEITDSVLENLGDSWHNYWDSEYKELVLESTQALVEKITLLRNFIAFATLQGGQHPEFKDLLSWVDAVALNAAHLSHICQCNSGKKEWWMEVQFKISVLLEKIKPIGPQVFETYTRALTFSKLGRQSHAPTRNMNGDPIIIMKDFIHSLAGELWEMLQMDICLKISVKDQLQALYQGLRFFRNSLKEQPNKLLEDVTKFRLLINYSLSRAHWKHRPKGIFPLIGNSS